MRTVQVQDPRGLLVFTGTRDANGHVLIDSVFQAGNRLSNRAGAALVRKHSALIDTLFAEAASGPLLRWVEATGKTIHHDFLTIGPGYPAKGPPYVKLVDWREPGGTEHVLREEEDIAKIIGQGRYKAIIAQVRQRDMFPGGDLTDYARNEFVPERRNGGVRRNGLREDAADPTEIGEIFEMDATLGPLRSNPPGWPIIVNPAMRRNARISAQQRVTRGDYPGVFGDYDADGTPDADDAAPYDARITDTVEEVQLSQEISELIALRDAFTGTLDAFKRQLAGQFPGRQVYGRVKTPYSMINKLRRKRLLHPTRGITDLVATTVVADDEDDLGKLVQFFDSGLGGAVREKEDFYALPGGLGGYRAVHYIIDYPSAAGTVPVEVQVKTKRQKALSAAGHTAYKSGNLDSAALDRLSLMARAADQHRRGAAKSIDALLATPAKLGRILTGQAALPPKRR